LNFLEIEKLRSDTSRLLSQFHGLPKVLLLYSYFEKLLATNNTNLINAFSQEFINEYLTELDSYSPFYSEPEKCIQLLDQLSALTLVPSLGKYCSRIKELNKSVKEKLDHLLAILDGKDVQEKSAKLLFPLLGKVVTSFGTYEYASLEPVKVKIAPAKHKNTFLFIPSRKKSDELEEQAIISFRLALQYLGNYRSKFHKFHEVIIYFDNLEAEYEGRSLGIALTIGFISQLSELYNLPYLIHIKGNIASTGGLSQNGETSSLGENIVRQKIEAAFYSDIETIIIPSQDESFAKEKLKELKKYYPNRLLSTVSVENLTDLLNRRNLVAIIKQSPLVRSAKNIKKNWISVSLSLIIFLIVSFIWIREFDDNPSSYDSTEYSIRIINKNYRTLWNIPFRNSRKDPGNLERSFRILDVNNDGINEVLFVFDHNSKYSDKSISEGLALLDYQGKIIWRRSFAKGITSKREVLSPPYGTNMYDTLIINNDLCILCGFNNSNSYVSAVYILNLRKNEVVSDTLWNSGHISDVRVVELNNDNEKELLILSCNNGLQKNSILHLNVDELRGQVPTTDEYKLQNIQDAKILGYFLFPNTDYNQYLGYRWTSLKSRGMFMDNESKIVRFISLEAGPENGEYIVYNWYYKKNEFDIAIGNELRVPRDSLVAHGKLPLPYTDTKEYRELLKSQIRYWNGKDFVKREGLK